MERTEKIERWQKSVTQLIDITDEKNEQGEKERRGPERERERASIQTTLFFGLSAVS